MIPHLYFVSLLFSSFSLSFSINGIYNLIFCVHPVVAKKIKYQKTGMNWCVCHCARTCVSLSPMSITRCLPYSLASTGRKLLSPTLGIVCQLVVSNSFLWIDSPVLPSNSTLFSAVRKCCTKLTCLFALVAQKSYRLYVSSPVSCSPSSFVKLMELFRPNLGFVNT